MTPWAMLMMSSTPKIRVSPTAISAYTPPPRMPVITAWISLIVTISLRCAPVRAPDRSAGPGWLRVQNLHRTRRADWQDLDELAVLPLEDVRGGGAVAAEAVECNRPLHAAQRGAAVQVGDDLRVVGAASRLDRLESHLPDRVGLGHVRVDPGGGAAVLGDILSDHLLALRVGRAAVPGVRHHHPAGVPRAHHAGEGGALVRAGGADEDLRHVVLLLERLHDRSHRRHVGRAEHYHLRLGP